MSPRSASHRADSDFARDSAALIGDPCQHHIFFGDDVVIEVLGEAPEAKP